MKGGGVDFFSIKPACTWKLFRLIRSNKRDLCLNVKKLYDSIDIMTAVASIMAIISGKLLELVELNFANVNDTR